MIDFYTYSTFNGKRVAIMLEETGLDYQTHIINLAKGEQRSAEFLGINPSGRIPTIIDDGLILTQSAAILIYLAEKSGVLLPTDTIARAKVMEWLCFNATDISPAMFDSYYLTQRCQPAQPQAAELLNQRIFMLFQNFDNELAQHEFIGGDSYSIADIAMFPTLPADTTEFFQSYPNLQRWFQLVSQRPAVQIGMQMPV